MRTRIFAVGVAILAVETAGAAERRISIEDYRDRMEGAWIGQMVGVSWGQPTEFRWSDAIIPDEKVPTWRSEMPLEMAYGNDDLYVEMTFLRTLEQYGLDVSIRQAGLDFANSEYGLWCANRAGRTNLRKGIAPPDSSHPSFNLRANDIDYQIESDYAGIISPGCPREVIRLGNVFGRLMNFGDGMWAGQFVGAMYAEAFFTSDVDRLLDAGLRAIPSESDYAKMVRGVRELHRKFPTDWTKTWEGIRAAWSKKYNPQMKDSNGGIDVRLNGALVVMGLLYGNGDLDQTMVIAMRGGYDSDCNPSTVGGILGCARGRKAFPSKFTAKLDESRPFSHTAYNQKSLYAVCEKLARQVVVRNGGRVEKDASGRTWFVIPEQTATPDVYRPSWAAGPAAGSRFTEAEMAQQKFALKLPNPATLVDPDPTIRVQKALDALWPGWKTSKNAPDMDPGYREVVDTQKGQVYGCVVTHPPAKGVPVSLSRTLKIPNGNPMLHFEVANSVKGDFRLLVRVNGVSAMATDIFNPWSDDWRSSLHSFDLSLEPWAGQTVKIELVNMPTGWSWEAAVWHNLAITANSGASTVGL